MDGIYKGECFDRRLKENVMNCCGYNPGEKKKYRATVESYKGRQRRSPRSTCSVLSLVEKKQRSLRVKGRLSRSGNKEKKEAIES